ncbi:MAG: hypothetical protein OHK0031_06260 [Anaerolineales bacterium]
MIELTWPGKRPPLTPPPAAFQLDSLLHPQPENPAQPSELYLGDNLAVMAALLPQWENRIDLIYADPPFFTNRNFSARIGRGEDSRKPQDWQLASGYTDAWSSLESYLQFLYDRLALMHRLLAPSGTLYLHLDWHADAYARLLLDEIFGPERLLNQISWNYHGPSPIRSAFNRKHDVIFSYTKSENYTFNADAVRVPYDENTLKTFAASRKAGFGKIPDLQRGKVPEDWWYFPVVARLHSERTGYPTQKPEALLERIILASSNPGEIVADFFCGSGTTPLMADRLDRRFIASDSSLRAIQTTRARLARSPLKTASRLWLAAPLTRSPAPFEFSIESGSVILAGKSDSINFWEVDPDFDGEVFHSRAQAARPLRGGALNLRLPLNKKNPAGQICLRAVDNTGEQYQTILAD